MKRVSEFMSNIGGEEFFSCSLLMTKAKVKGYLQAMGRYRGTSCSSMVAGKLFLGGGSPPHAHRQMTTSSVAMFPPQILGFDPREFLSVVPAYTGKISAGVRQFYLVALTLIAE